ncbi:fibroblast growth factor 9-like [Liolophura sinensis]|uniref:fibroblast growth factor 9-like n=1 Tax=Liolophura sinensis TaxID=3198878 RepID=UPI0031591429
MCDAPDTTVVHVPPGFTGPSESGNKPTFWGPRKRLCSRTGFNLCIAPTGKVYGTYKESDKNANLVLESASPGIVSIRGEESNLYLGFNNKGRLVGMAALGEECLFEERILPIMYSVYLSHKYADKHWYIAINRRGKARNGKRTRLEKKSSHFLPREITDGV